MGSSGGGTEVVKETSMTPSQRRIADQLAQFFGGRIGQPMERYPGKMVAGMGGMERMGMGQLRQAMGAAGERPMYQGALKRALGGMSPGQMQRYYERAIEPGQQRMFQEQVMPQIAESMQMAGLGTSSDRARAEIEAAQRMQEFGGGQLAQLTMRGREMGQAAIPVAMQAEQQRLQGLTQTGMAGMQAGALPRMLRQQEMQAKMQEFMRTRPEMSPVIQQALSFLGIPQMMAYGEQQPQVGLLGQILGLTPFGQWSTWRSSWEQ